MLNVHDPEFRAYGRYIGKFPEITYYLKAHSPMPKKEDVNLYVRDDPDFRELAEIKTLHEVVFGLGPIQAGYCNGYNSKLNCLEAHGCPEVNVAGEDLVLLLATRDDICEGEIDSSKVKPFLVKKGEGIVLLPFTLHFSPCAQQEDGFRCAVLLSAGTNEDIPCPKGALWKTNKWLFAHPESKQAKLGAYVGITGENIEVKW